MLACFSCPPSPVRNAGHARSNQIWRCIHVRRLRSTLYSRRLSLSHSSSRPSSRVEGRKSSGIPMPAAARRPGSLGSGLPVPTNAPISSVSSGGHLKLIRYLLPFKCIHFVLMSFMYLNSYSLRRRLREKLRNGGHSPRPLQLRIAHQPLHADNGQRRRRRQQRLRRRRRPVGGRRPERRTATSSQSPLFFPERSEPEQPRGEGRGRGQGGGQGHGAKGDIGSVRDGGRCEGGCSEARCRRQSSGAAWRARETQVNEYLINSRVGVHGPRLHPSAPNRKSFCPHFFSASVGSIPGFRFHGFVTGCRSVSHLARLKDYANDAELHSDFNFDVRKRNSCSSVHCRQDFVTELQTSIHLSLRLSLW